MSKKIMKKIVSIEKQELSAEKVDLAGQYDFTDFKKQYHGAFTDYRADYRKGINAAKNATDRYFTNLNKILRDAESTIDEFGNKAEELGVDYRGTKQFQQFQEVKKILLSAISNAKEKQREVSKIM